MSTNNTEISRVRNQTQFDEFLQKGAVVLYENCFSEPPYEEKFDEGEVEALLSVYVDLGILLSACDDAQVIGFAAAVPLFLETEIASIARKFNILQEKTWYFADLGVEKKMRRNKLGTMLVDCLIGQLPKQDLLMRTNENNIASRSLNEKLGFKMVKGMKQEVNQIRQNGAVESDQRIFLLYENTAKKE